MNKVISVMTHVISTFPPYKFQRALKINKKVKIINGSKRKRKLNLQMMELYQNLK